MVSISGNANSIASEPERAFPLHVGCADHLASRRLAVGGRRAMQIDQPVRHEFKGFAVLSVVVEERLLHAGSFDASQRCRQTIASSPDAGEPDHRKPRYPAISFNPLENVGK